MDLQKRNALNSAMRYREFLVEEDHYLESPTLSDQDIKMAASTTKQLNELLGKRGHRGIAEIITRNALPWLHSTNRGKWALYRGTSVPASENPIFLESWSERPGPTDTVPRLHEIFNTVIGLAGGSANRNTRWFTIADPAYASARGNLFIFIPLRKYKFTYAPRVRDWTNDFDYHKLYSMLKPTPERDEIDARVTRKAQGYIEANPQYTVQGGFDTIKSMTWTWLNDWGDFFNDPASYDVERVKAVIKTEKTGSLVEAHHNDVEVMFKGPAALYLNRDLWLDVRDLI